MEVATRPPRIPEDRIVILIEPQIASCVASLIMLALAARKDKWTLIVAQCTVESEKPGVDISWARLERDLASRRADVAKGLLTVWKYHNQLIGHFRMSPSGQHRRELVIAKRVPAWVSGLQTATVLVHKQCSLSFVIRLRNAVRCGCKRR